jgi:hypothetical protein
LFKKSKDKIKSKNIEKYRNERDNYKIQVEQLRIHNNTLKLAFDKAEAEIQKFNLKYVKAKEKINELESIIQKYENDRKENELIPAKQLNEVRNKNIFLFNKITS